MKQRGTEAELAALAEQRKAWCESVSEGDTDRYAALLAEDAVWLPPGQAALGGRQAIRVWLEPFLERYRYDFAVSPAHVRVAGAFAVETGRFTSVLAPKAGGESLRHEGRYLLFWRRSSAGVWQMERYLDTSDLGENGR